MNRPPPIDDRGLLLGDGLFETLLVRDGQPVLVARHLGRMRAGALALGLPAPAEETMRRAVLEAVAAAGLQSGRAAVRLTLTAGSGGRGLDRPATPRPRLLASAAPAPSPSGPVALTLARTRRNEGSPASRLKTLSYIDSVLARREAAAAGADEALMTNNRGELACASAANLFWLQKGRLFTPAIGCGVLAGVMRGEIMARAGGCGLEVVETVAAVEALDSAEAVMISNSLIGLRAAGAWRGRALAGGEAVEALKRALVEVS